MPQTDSLVKPSRRRVHKTYEKVKATGANFFGKTLKEFRLQRNLTQGEAAKLLSISQSQWSGYEKGSSKPTLDTIITIAEKFQVDPLVLIGKSIDKFKFPNDPGKELSFAEYEAIIQKVVENYRNTRLQFPMQ